MRNRRAFVRSGDKEWERRIVGREEVMSAERLGSWMIGF